MLLMLFHAQCDELLSLLVPKMDEKRLGLGSDDLLAIVFCDACDVDVEDIFEDGMHDLPPDCSDAWQRGKTHDISVIVLSRALL